MVPSVTARFLGAGRASEARSEPSRTREQNTTLNRAADAFETRPERGGNQAQPGSSSPLRRGRRTRSARGQPSEISGAATDQPMAIVAGSCSASGERRHRSRTSCAPRRRAMFVDAVLHARESDLKRVFASRDAFFSAVNFSSPFKTAEFTEPESAVNFL